jgi:phosphoribosylglycinamide formyltransferase-1
MALSRKRVAVLISGRGSNMRALIEAAATPDYPAEVVVVIANRPDAAGLTHAAACGIATTTVDHTRFGDREAFERALQQDLQARSVDLVCLAGFMRLLTPWFVQQWTGRMLNIHPALLPSFKGLHTHEAALRAGVRIHGATVHFVATEMDSGPIIAQGAAPVLIGDTPATLAARVLTVEHRLYPLALRLVAEGRVRIEDGRCVIAGDAAEGALLVPQPDDDPNEKPPVETGGYGKNQKPVGDWSSA